MSEGMGLTRVSEGMGLTIPFVSFVFLNASLCAFQGASGTIVTLVKEEVDCGDRETLV